MPRQVRLLRELLAEKWRENALSALRRDARPAIVHRKLQDIVRCELGRDTNGRTRRRVLDRVLEQIRQYTLDLGTVHRS